MHLRKRPGQWVRATVHPDSFPGSSGRPEGPVPRSGLNLLTDVGTTNPLMLQRCPPASGVGNLPFLSFSRRRHSPTPVPLCPVASTGGWMTAGDVHNCAIIPGGYWC